MFKFWTALFFLFASAGFSEIVNKVIASVGNYTISDYDLRMAREFNILSGGQSQDPANDAFKDLILSYSLLNISESDERYKIQPQEIDSYITSITNSTNSGDQVTEFRKKLFQIYPEQFKLQLKKSKVMQALMFYDIDLKEKVNQPVSDADIKSFYEKNKKSFVEPPTLDIIVIGVKPPANLSLDQLSAFENNLGAIASSLKKTNDYASLMKKYEKSMTFEAYSGRTGKRLAYELLKDYPEEVVNIPFIEKIPTPKGVIIMKPGVVFGPQLVPIRKTGENVYLIIKVIDRQMSKPMDFESARPNIESRLKEDRMSGIIEKYVADKLNNGNIAVTIMDKTYEGVYNEFIRR